MIALLLWVLAAVFNAVMDTLAHHYNVSIFSSMNPKKDSWWNPLRSWKNKYKDNDKWYGWINDTILVWTTDAWHLSQALMKLCLLGAILTYSPIISWYWDAMVFIGSWGISFELFYKYILKR